MKYAKKRGSPTLSRLLSSTRRADRAISSALRYVGASNQRLAKHKTGTLEQLLAQMPDGPPVDLAWENLTPVGLEVVDGNEPPAAEKMREFMVNAPPSDISTVALKALIDEGRD